MRKQDLAAVSSCLFEGEAVVMRDSDECWAGIGVCGAQRLFLLAPWNGVVPVEMLQGASAQCDMALLIVSEGAVAVPELHSDIPLVAVIDGQISAPSATSLWQADLIVATGNAPKSLRDAADLTGGDIDEAIAKVAQFAKILQNFSVQSAPGAQENILDIVPADAEQAFETGELLDVLCEQTFVSLKGSNSLMLGVGQINGNAVAIVASKPANNDGRIGVEDCYAALRLIELARSMRLPVLSIQDTAGMADEGAGQAAGLPDAVEAVLQGWSSLDMPVFTLVVGRAYGLAHVVLAGASTRPTALLAWPRAAISLDAPAPGDERASIMMAAKGFGVHDVIDPRTTGQTISALLSLWQV